MDDVVRPTTLLLLPRADSLGVIIFQDFVFIPCIGQLYPICVWASKLKLHRSVRCLQIKNLCVSL